MGFVILRLFSLYYLREAVSVSVSVMFRPKPCLFVIGWCAYFIPTTAVLSIIHGLMNVLVKLFVSVHS